MPLINVKTFKSDTSKWFSRRNGAIKNIDDMLSDVECAMPGKKWEPLINLRNAIEEFKLEKTIKHGNYEKSKREGAKKPIAELEKQVLQELLKFNLNNDLTIARNICGTLFDVKIIDVDFSDSVKNAAKKKMIAGKSVYQTVKDDWMSKDRVTDYREHEASMTQAKLKTALPFGPKTIPLSELDKIAAVVKKHRYAVCESITATIISECKKKGFAGKLEWIGIPYGKKSGHSIVLANRIGDITEPNSWGDYYFIVDMWYYNLGMRDSYVFSGGARNGYVQKDIKPYLRTSGGLKIMATI